MCTPGFPALIFLIIKDWVFPFASVLHPSRLPQRIPKAEAAHGQAGALSVGIHYVRAVKAVGDLEIYPLRGSAYIRKGNGYCYAVIPYFALNIPDTGARALFIKAVQCVFTRRSGKGVSLPALEGRGAAADIQVHEIRDLRIPEGRFRIL